MVDPGNRERGLRAAISNARVSQQAKQRDRQILEAEFGEHFEESPEEPASEEDEAATEMANDKKPPAPLRVRQTAGLHASDTQLPVARGAREAGDADSSKLGRMHSSSADAARDQVGGKDVGNVIRGLKAAISNPGVSEAAKEKDRKKLRELGETV